MDNQIIYKYFSHQGFPELERALQEISNQTGFEVKERLQSRFIYKKDKVWRVRFSGIYQGRPAALRVENLKLETDEEQIRQAFRRQCAGTSVRPPQTYLANAFEENRGYGFSIEELVQGRKLFDPEGEPDFVVKEFTKFYPLMRAAVREPFWPKPETSKNALDFSQDQAKKWLDLAAKQNPEHTEKVLPLCDRLKGAMLDSLSDIGLRFQHAHLSGWDVIVSQQGDRTEYVVFANHFWSWRQESYDVAFPMWGQWLALPAEKRSADNVRHVTETWTWVVTEHLSDLTDPRAFKAMIFNRLYGSLLLDVPTMIDRQTVESVQALENALIAEAERLLA